MLCPAAATPPLSEIVGSSDSGSSSSSDSGSDSDSDSDSSASGDAEQKDQEKRKQRERERKRKRQRQRALKERHKERPAKRRTLVLPHPSTQRYQPIVWKGSLKKTGDGRTPCNIWMRQVAGRSVNALPLKPAIKDMGRIRHQQVKSFVSKVLKAGSRTVLAVTVHAATQEDQALLEAFASFFRGECIASYSCRP